MRGGRQGRLAGGVTHREKETSDIISGSSAVARETTTAGRQMQSPILVRPARGASDGRGRPGLRVFIINSESG